NGKSMFCCKIEEKILPSVVVKQAVLEKIKQLENVEQRKIGYKEKQVLKEEVTQTLLPRAFVKSLKVYAYIDSQRRWLVLGTHHKKRAEQFIDLFKKTISNEITIYEVKDLSAILTRWLLHQNFPNSFVIEKAGVLHGANEQKRIIRCQQQNLFSDNIIAFIKDGCAVKQLALTWQDRIKFVLTHNFSIQSIKFQEEVIEQVKQLEPETALQQFHADLVIMTETFSQFFDELTAILN